MNAMKIKTIIEQHAKWLREEGGERADLSGAVLRHADLRGANLNDADLGGAVLSGAIIGYGTMQMAGLGDYLQARKSSVNNLDGGRNQKDRDTR